MKHYPVITLDHPLHFMLWLALWLSTCFTSLAQNLVPNPGFEEYSECPFQGDVTGPMPCPPWVSLLSCNYFNVCYPGPFGVPDNFQGFQYAHSGDGYTGGYQEVIGGGGRELIQVQLLEPLVGGQCYEVSFFANLSNQSCGINHLGALFTNTPVENWEAIGMIPQIDAGGQFFTDTVNWFEISGTFVAAGGEEYLTIGNFYHYSETQFAVCNPSLWWAYYYWDDVVVQETETFLIDVDLGGPYEACDYVILDPGIPDAHYGWSDGSQDPTLIVTTSGTYTVVVSFDGCIGGLASTDVTILGSPPVSLGPDVTMCAGETYTINLDEFAGDYVWQDGTMEAEYTISTSGYYSVLLDDGCDQTWDDIYVNVLEPPAPFSLGDDAIVCPGQTLVFEFDPSLGVFEWQDHSTHSTYFIGEAGIYSLTISNDCGETSDEIEITTIDPPEFILSPDSVILCNGDSINLNFDENMGDFVWQDGSTFPYYTIDTTGDYALTVSNACGTLSDAMSVLEISVPVVNLGGSVLLCPGENLVLEAGDNYGDITWQDGSSDPQYIVTTSGVYSLTVTNDCGSDSGFVTVDVELPVIPPDLGPDVNLCPGEQLILEVLQPDVSIHWSDFSTGNTLIVTTSGTYFVNVSTICESYSDTVVITVQNDPPSINLPADFALCQGQSTLLDAGITNVAYLWNDGSQLSQLNVSFPGIYSLTITNACGSDIDSILILNGGPAPIVSLGVDTSICAGDAITLFPAYANVNAWTWPDGSDTTFFITSASGQVYVQVSNDCGVAHDTMMIDLLPAVPTLALGPDTAICPGESVTLSIQIPNVDILWSDGSVNPDLTVSNSTTVFAAISNTCGVSTDTLNVDLLPDIPLLYLGPDQKICPGEIITISPEIPNVMYVWQDGSTNPAYQTSQQGTISLTISNSCSSTTDTIEITESAEGPQLDLGPDLQACEGESITIPAGIFGVNYIWQDGSTDDEFITSVSGTFYLTVHNLCGMDSDTIDVVISGMPPVTVLGPDTTLCEGSTLTLTSDADSSTSVMWQDGSIAPDFEVVVSGLYSLTQSNDCGVDSDSIEVIISGVAPFTSLGQDTTLCEGSMLILTSNADPFISGVWQDGSMSQDYEVVISGIYHLTQTNACGMDSDTIEVDIHGTPPVPALGVDTLLCEGNTLTLTSVADMETTTTWQNGSTLPTFLVTLPGTYILIQTNRCGENADSILVLYQPLPNAFDLGPDTVLCPGETLLLTAPVTSDELEWQDGSTAQTFLAKQAGSYSLTLSNECGMIGDELVFTYDDQLLQFPVEDEFALCLGDVMLLDVTQLFDATYIWSTGSMLPVITVSTPGVYAVTVRTECQEATDEITITVKKDCATSNDFYIPNVISPNGDNINDLFTIYTNEDIEILSIDGSIYDRWGDLIFSSTANPFMWDGRFGNVQVLPGVYVYKLELRLVVGGNETTEKFTGDITVVY